MTPQPMREIGTAEHWNARWGARHTLTLDDCQLQNSPGRTRIRPRKISPTTIRNGGDMKAKMSLLTLALCFAARTLCFASDAQMGTWKLNEAKSKIPAG